ncbi:MAG: alpha/beta hydrolase [Anaerolineae bacterium]|nr:alpha/beta hydrolase [Anaerolineae bacterium]
MVAAGYRVVTMDVRGHGESSTTWSDYSVVGVGKDMLALMRHLDAGAAIILGESLSAGAAVWAATEAPEQVAGLVLLGAVVRDAPTPAYMTPLLNILFAPLWGVAAWGMYFNTLFPAHKPADFATYRQKLLANLREPGRLSALKAMMLAKKDASEQRVSSVKAPTFIIMGTKDPDFKDPTAEAKWLAEQTHGKVMIIDGAGHYPHVEMIDKTAQPIIDFLKSIEVVYDA